MTDDWRRKNIQIIHLLSLWLEDWSIDYRRIKFRKSKYKGYKIVRHYYNLCLIVLFDLIRKLHFNEDDSIVLKFNFSIFPT